MSFDVTSGGRPARAPSLARTRRATKEESLIEVRRSPIQGRGVFARVLIPKGTRIVEYTGKRMSADRAEEEYDDEASRRHHTFLFSVNEKTVIDGLRGGNASRFINHSCEPNCYAEQDRGRIFIEARRDIAPGDELSYDYWYSTDASHTDADLRRLYPCNCGSKRCRGTLAAPKRPARTAEAEKSKKKTGKAGGSLRQDRHENAR
jgi:SET domain-containing protein